MWPPRSSPGASAHAEREWMERSHPQIGKALKEAEYPQHAKATCDDSVPTDKTRRLGFHDLWKDARSLLVAGTTI